MESAPQSSFMKIAGSSVELWKAPSGRTDCIRAKACVSVDCDSDDVMTIASGRRPV